MYSINKNLNKFIFIGEVCRGRDNPWNKERVQKWLKKSGGKLSQNEKLLSKEFSKILSGFNLNLIEAYFITLERDKLWKAVSEEIGETGASKIKEVLGGFAQRFNILWEQEEPRLAKIKNYLNSQSKKIGDTLATINELSGIKNEGDYSAQVPVHLAISSGKRKDVIGWFSTLDNKTDFVLECSGIIDDNYYFLSMVLLHEFFHLALRNNSKIRNQIKSISEDNQEILNTLSKKMSSTQILEELLISSFIPEGYLAVKCFGKKIKPIDAIKEKNGIVSFVSARQFCAYKLKKKAREYIDAGKVIDENYLISLIDVIKNR